VLLTEFVPVIVNMVNRQEQRVRLSAAGTTVAVLVVNQFAHTRRNLFGDLIFPLALFRRPFSRRSLGISLAAFCPAVLCIVIIVLIIPCPVAGMALMTPPFRFLAIDRELDKRLLRTALFASP
jgi:hypothetical protein